MWRVKVLLCFPSISIIATTVAIASTLVNSINTTIMIMIESFAFSLCFPSFLLQNYHSLLIKSFDNLSLTKLSCYYHNLKILTEPICHLLVNFVPGLFCTLSLLFLNHCYLTLFVFISIEDYVTVNHFIIY